MDSIGTVCAAALLLGAGCVPPGEVTAETDETPLFQGTGARLWKNGVVPVCYDPTDGDLQGLLGRARYLLDTYGWSAVANVRFTGWGACGAEPADKSNGQVRVHFASVLDSDGRGKTTAPGGALGSKFTDITLISATGYAFAAPADFDRHFQYVVQHELGHALGWAHEQKRPDNWPSGSSGPMKYCDPHDPPQSTEDVTGIVRTPYFDTESIMSYCTGWPQELSPGDVAGVQATYGRKPDVPNRGSNASNNAVSRGTGNLDTFFARSDGSIWTTYWYAGLNAPRWPTFQLPGSGPGTAPGGAPIAAVSRAGDNLDIFYVNARGGINSSWWYPASGWSTPFELPGTASLATPGAQIAAVSGSPGRLDVFFAGRDQDLYWSSWSGQCGNATTTRCGWSTPSRVLSHTPYLRYGSNGSITLAAGEPLPVGASLSAVARTPDRLDVFYLESDGQLHTSYCTGFGDLGTCRTGSIWPNGLTRALTGCQADAGGHLSATSRFADIIDVFYPSRSGALCTNWWTPTTGWQAYPVTGGNAMSSAASLTAVTRDAGHLDVFYSATDRSGTGVIATASWAGNWSFATAIDDGSGPRSVAATARTSNNLDVFSPGYSLFGGSRWLQTAYWYTGASGWASYSTGSY